MLQHKLFRKPKKKRIRGYALRKERVSIKEKPIHNLPARGTWIGYGFDLRYAGASLNRQIPFDALHRQLLAQEYSKHEQAKHLVPAAISMVVRK